MLARPMCVTEPAFFKVVYFQGAFHKEAQARGNQDQSGPPEEVRGQLETASPWSLSCLPVGTPHAVEEETKAREAKKLAPKIT